MRCIESNGRNGLILSVTALVMSMLILPSLAKEAQGPLHLDAVSNVQWEECGELSNHTLECEFLPYRMSSQADQKRLPNGCSDGSFE